MVTPTLVKRFWPLCRFPPHLYPRVNILKITNRINDKFQLQHVGIHTLEHLSLPLMKMKTSCQNLKYNYLRLLKSNDTQRNCGGEPKLGETTAEGVSPSCFPGSFVLKARPSQGAVKVGQTAKTLMLTPIFLVRGTRKRSPDGWRMKEEN